MWQEKHREIFEFERDGWFNYQDLYDMVFEKLSCRSGIVRLVEIGLWKGMSFSYLVSKAKECKLHEVYGVDTFNGDPNNHREQELISKMSNPLKEIFDSNMKSMDLKEGVDYQVMQIDSVVAASYVGDIDFVFIDSGHSEDQVRKDIETWYPKIKSGGVIAGHDYDCPGVAKVVREKFGNDFEVMNTSWIYTKE